jgi:hypothetical protein
MKRFVERERPKGAAVSSRLAAVVTTKQRIYALWKEFVQVSRQWAVEAT